MVLRKPILMGFLLTENEILSTIITRIWKPGRHFPWRSVITK